MTVKYKRLLALTLTISMLCSVIPAFALENDVSAIIANEYEINDISVTSINDTNNDVISTFVNSNNLCNSLIETEAEGNEAITETFSLTTPPEAAANVYSMTNQRSVYSLKNQLAKTYYTTDNIGEEYIDPLTGNLIIRETDFILKGRDGFNLNLSRFYSLSQAEFYTPKITLVTSPKTFNFTQEAYVVKETTTDNTTNQISTYYYPYYDMDEANFRKKEIETRDDCNNRYTYETEIVTYSAGQSLTIDYYYKTELASSSYTTMRSNLGAGWSWSFPSIQTIKEDYNDNTEIPSAIYYHDGKGRVLEAEYYESNEECYFKNYVGMDISIEYYPNEGADLGCSSVIDYIVEEADCTTYYFGPYGEIRRMKDIYGNTIDFYYGITKTYYGGKTMPLISKIVDSVGREIDFTYHTYNDTETIDVSITSPLEAEREINLKYEKTLVTVKVNNKIISKEPVLTSFKNAENEKTLYFASRIQDDLDADEEAERKPEFINFSLTDKSPQSLFVKETGGCQVNVVYLLGNIVRPSSNTRYRYRKTLRNLGHSGVTEAYNLQAIADSPFTLNNNDTIMLGDLYNLEGYTYGYQTWDEDYYLEDDYTGYPTYCSIDNISNNSIVRTVAAEINGVEQKYEYKKIDDSILLSGIKETYNKFQENELVVNKRVLSYNSRQPEEKIINYSQYGKSYNSYIYSSIIENPVKAFGKPELVTKEMGINDNREKYGTLYTYDTDTAFITSKSWYKDDDTKCTESYQYNDKNRISQITFADNTKVNYYYEYVENKVSKKTTITTNGDSVSTVIEKYNADTNYLYPYQVSKTTDNKTEVINYTYDMLLGVVTSETDSENNTTYYEYDNVGRLVKIIYPEYITYSSNDNSTIIKPIENISYDYVYYTYKDNRVILKRIRTENIYYNISNNEEITANTPKTFHNIRYDYYLGTGEILESKVYDLLSVNDNNFTLISNKYDYSDDRLVVTKTDSKGNISSVHKDGLGRTVKEVDEFGNWRITEYTVDGINNGFMAKSYFVPSNDRSKKENITETIYDRWNNPINTKAYLTSNDYIETKYTYDFVGNILSEIDANSNVTTYKYDKLNRVNEIKNAKNEIAEYVYDSSGNVKEQYINNQKLFERTYNADNNLLTDKDNANNSNLYTYDNKGRLTNITDKDLKTTVYTYNQSGLLNTETIAKPQEDILENRYGYYPSFGLQSVYSNKGSAELQLNEISNKLYSACGNLLVDKTEYELNNIDFNTYIEYNYDSEGIILLARYGNKSATDTLLGFSTHYEYNKNRISKVQLDGNNIKNTSDSVNAIYEFYDDGKLKSISYPLLSDNTILKSVYTYDELSRLTSLVNYKGESILSRYSYTYDNNGNILSVEETVLQEENTTNYTYDVLNRISTVSGTKGADSYYEYDARGNRKANFEQMDFLSEETVEYEYNAEDKLIYSKVGNNEVNIEYSSNGYRYFKQENTTYPEYYIYDEQGKLQGISKVVNVTTSSGTQTVMYPVTQYIWGPDRVLAKIDKTTNKSYYYLYNGHGDVVQIVDTSGAVKNTYDYDVWGNFLKKEETIENHFTYFGQTYDETTGLYYLRARYYDPTTGRFTQQDPAEDGYNWYVYGNQNPNVYGDATGEVVETIMDFAGVAWSLKDFITNPSWINAACLVWDVASVVVPFVPGSYVTKAGKYVVKAGSKTDDVVDALKVLNKTQRLDAIKDGAVVLPYKALKKLSKGTGLEAHHLIEKRFADVLKINSNDILSIALDKDTHQKITNAMRDKLPYSTLFNRRNYSAQDIWDATKKVYTDLGMDDYIEPLKQMLKDSGVTGISWGD